MKVGVVMPCINLWSKYTKGALDSVLSACNELNGFDYDILLIDNASTDETKTEALKYFSERYNPDTATAMVKRNEEMWGFQKSINYGINYFFDKGFDYILVLNNDIVLHRMAIKRLVERFSKGDVYMATCLDVTGEMQADRIEPHQINMLADGLKESVPEAPNPHFSAFMIDVRCWKEIGEFDEVFEPAYYEDNDYHYRMRLAQKTAIVHPPAMFYHYGSRTQNEALGRPLTLSHNQNMMYIRKWGDNPGKERFAHPYNDPSKPVQWTRQMELSAKT